MYNFLFYFQTRNLKTLLQRKNAVSFFSACNKMYKNYLNLNYIPDPNKAASTSSQRHNQGPHLKSPQQQPCLCKH